MKLRDVIAALQAKPEDLDEEVEFVIITKKQGRIIALLLETQAKAVKKALQLFA